MCQSTAAGGVSFGGGTMGRVNAHFKVLFILVVGTQMGFKPKTHMHSSNIVRMGDSGLTIGTAKFRFAPDVFDAIKTHPQCYRAGVVGPDGFPDIIFGQSLVHPEDKGYTHEWLNHIFEKGRNGSPCEKAFTFGYLTHAAGDLWAHTLVNDFAKGIFPGPADIAGSPPKANIALRHLITEGYIADFTPAGSPTSLSAPNGFVRDTFIRDRPRDFDSDTFCDSPHPRVPTPLAKGSHFDFFLDLRKDLCKHRADINPNVDAICLIDITLVSCAIQLFEAAKHAYMTAWISDIDRGLDVWPQFAEDISRDLFDPPDSALSFDAAKQTATDFLHFTLLSMLGVPDAVGAVLHAVDVVSAVVDTINPLAPLLEKIKSEFVDWIFRNNFGISYTELKARAKHPACHVDGAPMFPSNTSTKLDVLMTGGDVTRPTCNAPPTVNYNVDTFAAFANATMLSRLLLMEPTTLDAVLFELSVGKLYTGNRLAAELGSSKANLMKKNAMLGYAWTIDGNHAWRTSAPDFENGGQDGAGEGMPIWRDCLAHRRAFLTLFKDSDALNLVKTPNHANCEILSDPLPPLSMIREQKAPVLKSCCFVANVKITNHLDFPQRYFFYYRVRQGSAVRYHRVVSRLGDQALNSLESRVEEVSLGTCKPGQYTVELYLFDWMSKVRAESSDNVQIALRQPYWTVPIAKQTFRVIQKPRAQCDVAACSDQPTPDVTTGIGVTGGGGVPEVVAPVPGCCCADGPFPPLDADQDEVADLQDNCPTLANSDQSIRPCASSGGGNPLGIVKSFIDGSAPDFKLIGKLEQAIRSGALNGGQTPPDPCDTCPMCWSCPGAPAGMDAVIRAEARQWRRRRMDPARAMRRVEAIATGLRYVEYGVDVRSSRIGPRGRLLEYEVESKSGGKIAVDIPRVLMSRSYRVFVNNRRVRVQRAIGKDVASLLFNVPKGASAVKIRGR